MQLEKRKGRQNTRIQRAEKDPVRSPSWRWELAIELFESGVPAHEIEDPYIRDAIILLEVLHRGGHVPPELHDVYDAYRIYLSPSGMRSIVEGRILAGQTDAQIAEKTGSEPEIISIYERLFFNVRDRLAASDYIFTVVLGTNAHERCLYDIPTLWKLYGYIGGPEILNRLVYRFPDGRPGNSMEVSDFIRKEIRENLSLKAAIAARAARISTRTAPEIVKAYLAMLSLEDRESIRNTDSDFREVIRAIEWRTPARLVSEEKSLDDLNSGENAIIDVETRNVES